MKNYELVKILNDHNMNANVNVVAHNRAYDFSLTCGGGDGGEPYNCESISFYVDELCTNDNFEPFDNFYDSAETEEYR